MTRTSLPIRSHAATEFTTFRSAGSLKVRLLTLATGAGLLLTAGCGSVATAPEEPAAKAVQLTVSNVRFDKRVQLPGDQVTLSMTVENTGSNPAGNLIVSLEGNEPTQIAVAGQDDNPNNIPQGTSPLPDSIKRAAWFIDDGPQHAPIAGGDSWAAGPLEPGAKITLKWSMAAITAGRHTLNYFVSSGLTDNAAKATSGKGITGEIRATILSPDSAAGRALE